MPAVGGGEEDRGVDEGLTGTGGGVVGAKGEDVVGCIGNLGRC